MDSQSPAAEAAAHLQDGQCSCQEPFIPRLLQQDGLEQTQKCIAAASVRTQARWLLQHDSSKRGRRSKKNRSSGHGRGLEPIGSACFGAGGVGCRFRTAVRYHDLRTDSSPRRRQRRRRRVARHARPTHRWPSRVTLRTATGATQLAAGVVQSATVKCNKPPLHVSRPVV